LPATAAASRAGRSTVRRDRPALAASEGRARALRGKRIAYVAQSAAASFNPAHKLIDQYAEAPVVHGVMPRKKAEPTRSNSTAHALPNPDEIGFRYPHQVSGGQLQRAMTAMAMSCRPDLIIFDEPTTALDVTTQIEVLAAIRDIVASSTRRRSTSRTISPSSRRWPTGSRCCSRAPRWRRPTPADARRPARGLHQVPLGRAQLCPPERPPTQGRTPVVSVRNVTAAYGTGRCAEDVSFDIHAGAPWPWWARAARASPPRRGSSPGFCRRAEGEVLFNGEPLPPDYRRAPRPASPVPDDLSDGRHRAEPQASICAS
jgi:peptide/nickel transport system ATP-binding protein